MLHLLPAGNPSEWTGPTGNNTYLIPGRTPALIDAGVGNPEHVDAVARALEGRDLALVLITHGHSDHVKGIPALLERWPSVRVRRAVDPEQPLADGERIAAGDSTLTVIATPGHSPDHCCFFDERSGDLFCGDLARMGGTIVIPATKGGDLSAYLESLRRVQALRPARLLPGHGRIIDDPDALIDAYVQHRAAREAEILAALRAGAGTTEQIAERVYRGLPSGLRGAAAETVLAHLIKLRDEGRAHDREGRWEVQAG